MERLGWIPWIHVLDRRLECGRFPLESGVYELRCAIGDKPQAISRANGADSEGLLYIGKASNLRKRAWGLARGIKKRKKTGHIARRNYFYYNFERKFPPNHLQIRWAKIRKEQIKAVETKLLEMYLK